MQGGGISSLAIWTAFNTITTAAVRVLKHSVKIAWKRLEGSGIFASVGLSTVGGVDIVKGQESVSTKPDAFLYNDETARALRVEYERAVEEPLGGISLAQADVILDNTDLKFTPNKNSTIGTAILPNRPVNMSLGFEVSGQQKTLFVFKGLSDIPQESKVGRTTSIHSIDYIKFLDKVELSSTLEQDKRADEAIEDILTAAGFGSSQYELDEGLNIIKFLWFTKGQTAGDRIRQLCEAEEGHFFQDENGILRFQNRRKYNEAPYTEVQWTFREDDILEWFEDHTQEIINRCTVEALPREIQDETEIWRDGSVEVVNPGVTVIIFTRFQNPILTLTTPVATTDYVANSASDGTGSNLTANISIVATNLADTVKLEITNNGPTNAFMTFLALRGTPATIISEIKQTFEDSDSIAKYEEHVLEIRNDFIDDNSFAQYLANAIVQKYKDPARRIRIRVRAVPQLQLKDMVAVYDQDLETTTNYRVMRITGTMSPGSFEQTLTLREITDQEADRWATVNLSVVEGPDVVGI